MNPALTEEEMVEIFNSVYAPWLKTIDRFVVEAQKRFGYSLLIDGHSFPSVSAKGVVKKEDFILGTRDFKTADVPLIDLVMQNLIIGGKTVSIDAYGWNGGYTTGHYSKLVSPNSQALQIETNKKIYMDEQSFVKSASFDEIKDHISKTLEKIAEYKPNQAAA
jgi:N-formylglutamate amidohydrolase